MDGLAEPTTSTVILPDIPRLSSDSDFVTWASAIQNCLIVEILDSLIDPSKLRLTAPAQPLPLKWRF
jgi:hypothetical protein